MQQQLKIDFNESTHQVIEIPFRAANELDTFFLKNFYVIK